MYWDVQAYANFDYGEIQFSFRRRSLTDIDDLDNMFACWRGGYTLMYEGQVDTGEAACMMFPLGK